VLYLTIYLGLLAQILLGIIQIIIAIYITAKTTKSNIMDRKLKVCWVLAFTYLASFLLITITDPSIINTVIAIIYFVVIPMAVGVFLLSITAQLNNGSLSLYKK